MDLSNHKIPLSLKDVSNLLTVACTCQLDRLIYPKLLVINWRDATNVPQINAANLKWEIYLNCGLCVSSELG